MQHLTQEAMTDPIVLQQATEAREMSHVHTDAVHAKHRTQLPATALLRDARRRRGGDESTAAACAESADRCSSSSSNRLWTSPLSTVTADHLHSCHHLCVVSLPPALPSHCQQHYVADTAYPVFASASSSSSSAAAMSDLDVLRVKFTHSNTVREKKPYTIYEIEVRSSSTITWVIYKRYTAFYALHQQLLKAILSLPESQRIVLPPLPPKRLTRSLAAEFVEKRKNELQGQTGEKTRRQAAKGRQSRAQARPATDAVHVRCALPCQSTCVRCWRLRVCCRRQCCCHSSRCRTRYVPCSSQLQRTVACHCCSQHTREEAAAGQEDRAPRLQEAELTVRASTETGRTEQAEEGRAKARTNTRRQQHSTPTHSATLIAASD